MKGSGMGQGGEEETGLPAEAAEPGRSLAQRAFVSIPRAGKKLLELSGFYCFVSWGLGEEVQSAS